MNERHSNIVAKLFCKTFYIIWKKKLNNADIWDFSYYFTSVIRQEEKENTYFKLLLSHMI